MQNKYLQQNIESKRASLMTWFVKEALKSLNKFEKFEIIKIVLIFAW